MPPLTREPPPTPRPTNTEISANRTRSSTPAYGVMFLLTRSSQRKVASGASVRLRNHIDRRSGAVIVQNVPPAAVVGQFWPISRTAVRMPAWPSRSAATAPP